MKYILISIQGIFKIFHRIFTLPVMNYYVNFLGGIGSNGFHIRDHPFKTSACLRWGGKEGSKIYPICRRIVLKNCRRQRDRGQKLICRRIKWMVPKLSFKFKKLHQCILAQIFRLAILLFVVIQNPYSTAVSLSYDDVNIINPGTSALPSSE